jgi:oxalate decarboxylase/phosphoglucose isomerase-like protein (cupin superfamily)
VDVASLAGAEPFTTKDGSTIRELHHTQAQSLAEATLEPGATTERHYHRRTEEIYFLLQGNERWSWRASDVSSSPAMRS